MINCTFENGNAASLRHAVVDTLVFRGDEILLVKRTKKLSEGGKWALPGGYMELGETVAEAAARETLEETGWQVQDLQLFMINSNPDRPAEDRQNVSFVFACSATEKTGDSDWESDEVKWFPLSELPPVEQLAFDHGDYISRFIAQKNHPQTVPILI